MSENEWKMPPERDFGFYQRRKHDKWRQVPAPLPALEGPVADTHAHMGMLPDPAWELERAAANNVLLVGQIADPTDDDFSATAFVGEETRREDARDFSIAAGDAGLAQEAVQGVISSGTYKADSRDPIKTTAKFPRVVYTFGVHPHNAKDYTPEIEELLLQALQHPDARVLGEIGLDYHYDLSPRDVQRDVFRHQLQFAHELQLPVALHLRSGETPADNAHSEAFEILQQEGFPAQGTLLHCCALAPDQLQPWIDAGCYIAYGGALTFKRNDAARDGALLVPRDRLLLETDSPFMTPEPMRGATCTPAHVIFTAAELARILGAEPGSQRAELLQQIWKNSHRFFGIEEES